MDDEFIPEDEIAAAMALGSNVIQHWFTVVAAGEELLGCRKGGAGGGSGWMDETEEPPKTKRTRRVFGRRPCEDTEFGIMLANEPALLDPTTREAKQFRKRMRLPFQVFQELVKCAKQGEWFVAVKSDVAGRRVIPIEIKVMASLYNLGRAAGANNVAMLSGMSETTVRATFNTFCRKMVEDLHNVHVRLPEGDDLTEVMVDISNYLKTK